MSNEIYINQLLDDHVHQKLNRSDTVRELMNLGLNDAESEIDLHYAAVIAIRKDSVLQQVKRIHLQFLQDQLQIAAGQVERPARIIRIKPVKWILRVAAILIVATGGWLAYLYTTNSSAGLFSEIYQPYKVNTDRAKIEEIVPHNLIQEFKERNYAAVIKTYSGLTVTNNREKFLTAIAYQEMGDHTRAINLLKEVLQLNQQQKTRLYNDEAEFYLALNYLKMKNTKEALPLFQKIYDDRNHSFHERISKGSLRKMQWLD